ncbi:MAG: hypothetical protein NT007_03275 [Candidatus Kapabacteria bacterium]|nr:hypothetical protein [Candidatus Kapabacteria bacterium]
MKNSSLLLVILTTVSFFIISCSKNETATNPNTSSVASCEGCHTNYAQLKLVFTPDSITGGSSCGGETPHYEPYERVFINGNGFDAFKKSSHYKIGCVGCHNGDGDTDDKKKAHSGSFLAHPTFTQADSKCRSCHSDEVDRHKNSLHQMGWGQKRKVCLRMGLKDASEYDKLPQTIKDGYEFNCAKCHAATCGDCHINRPMAMGGGLMNGHQFIAKPDMINTCVGCHTSRGGHAFLGVGSGTKPDVHLTKANYTCVSCHSKDEIHGTGKFVEQRYKYDQLPKCVNCHPNLETKNQYHAVHFNTFSCQTCHSQTYNNCGSCHINGHGSRIPSYMDFKIGVNPIPDAKPGFKFALVRRALAAPDEWELYGFTSQPNFNAVPVYNYTSPHNILRWTERTQVANGKPCFDACHIVKEDTTLRNKKWFLFKSDLQLDYEKSSSSGISVDDKVPQNWLK